MEAKYDRIGAGYNLTRKADPYLTQQLFHHLQPNREGRYLDMGCGTGNYTVALQQRGFDFTGIDPSIRMLDKARIKNKQISWQLGSAEEAGLPDHHVDGIIASLTLHHCSGLKTAFAELYRILKSGGKIVIFTSTPQQMQGYWLNHYFPKMLADSIRQMPSLEQVKEAMDDAGFHLFTTEKYFVKSGLQDHFLYCGKHHPELYFNEQIRNGISSFSSLANREEVESGLLAMRNDVDSGRITEIIQSYENENGDYIFVVGEK